MPETDSLAPAITAQFQALHRLIGNTPLRAVDVRYRGEPRRIYAKYESLSLTGSVILGFTAFSRSCVFCTR